MATRTVGGDCEVDGLNSRLGGCRNAEYLTLEKSEKVSTEGKCRGEIGSEIGKLCAHSCFY